MSAPVVLIGFMGAGKTRVGRLVARRLGAPFIDSDALISSRFGPVGDLFRDRGEAGFRALEREVVLAELDRAAGEGTVLSLGGGSVTIDDVRARLEGFTNVVWLDAPVDVLYERARRGDRPLAGDADAFRSLYEARRPVYSALARLEVLATNDDSPSALARRIVVGVGRA